MNEITIGKVKIHPAFFITIFAFVFAENSIFSLCVLFCAAFHELGHMIAIKLLGERIAFFELAPFGAEIILGTVPSYKTEFFIALAGPAFSFLLAFAVFLLYLVFPCSVLLFICVSSLFLGFLNLVPVRSFDGGRCIRCILFSFFEYEKAERLSGISELLSLLILSAFSVWAVIFASYNLSLCFICLYIFVSAYIKNKS